MASGVRNGDRMVEIAVSETDSATLPPDRYVMTFEATPPGAAPMRMMPAASGPLNPNARASTAARLGMMRNWSPAPTSAARGIRATRAKSPRPSVVPMPNMMTWISTGTSQDVDRPPHSRKSCG